jgi:adenylate cyclase
MWSMSDKSDQDPKIEKVWRTYLSTGENEQVIRQRRFFGRLPSNPSFARCKNCYAPFHGLGAPVVRVLYNKRPARYNPKFCNACETFARMYQGGAEVEMAMLFADIRGSTTLAEGMSTTEFQQLINRFYKHTTDVLVHEDAFIDRLAGDEVIAFFFPGVAGEDYIEKAVKAATDLLRATGHEDAEGPWVPVGAGVHAGVAFFGAVGTVDGMMDMTALGDPVNTAARIAAQAGTGELLVSEEAISIGELDASGMEERQLELKGKSEPIGVRLLRVGPE